MVWNNFLQNLVLFINLYLFAIGRKNDVCGSDVSAILTHGCILRANNSGVISTIKSTVSYTSLSKDLNFKFKIL